MMIRDWFNAHKKNVLVHALILGGFLLFILFAVEPLFDKFERFPGEAHLHERQLPAETNDINYFIDRFSVYDGEYLYIQGWAFIKEKPAKNSEHYVILKSTDRTFIFGTEITMRPDVTNYFKGSNLDLDHAGFMARIPLKRISTGQYAIGLYIRKKSIEAIQYTNKVILKSGGTVQIIPR